MNKNKSRRPQAPKFSGMGNRAFHDAMAEIGRSSATDRHRDRSKYDRRDERRDRQKGWA